MDTTNTLIPTEIPTCRICRSEGTIDEPLFHPCRCSGSIRNVHQDCLVEWLAHSQKKHCELCKTQFRFTKLYDAHMPAVLPLTVFIRRAIIHFVRGFVRAVRAVLVATIWLLILPWFVRWAWRWMFWFADAGWARDIYLARLRRTTRSELTGTSISTNTTWNTQQVTESLREAVSDSTMSFPQGLYDSILEVFMSVGSEIFINNTQSLPADSWKHSDATIFSSMSYLSSMTPYPRVNRVILDVAEGQLITSTVILAFILIFLIREWVVQQVPVVNPEQLRQQREQLIEAERQQRQRRLLLEQARKTLEELEGMSAEVTHSLEEMEETVASESQSSRPRMPDRNASSRAIRVQRLLEEADALYESHDFDAPESSRKAAERNEEKHDTLAFSELPITNAGPDAKLNIKRDIKGKATAVPAPKDISRPLISNDELEKRLNALKTEGTEEVGNEQELIVTDSTITEEVVDRMITDEPEEAEHEFHDAIAVHTGEDVMVATATMHGRQEQIANQDISSPSDLDVDTDEASEQNTTEPATKSTSDRITDWFWGDIQPTTPEVQIAALDEHHHHADEAPFVPIVPAQVHPLNRDPEVVAAAREAGLDAEAVEDAEDIDGILELIGLQGPIAGLVQTSLFCMLLVVCTVAGAVVLPYTWGKLVLSFIGSPLSFLVIMPLRIVSFLTDLFVDVTLFFAGWCVTLGALGARFLLGTIVRVWPQFGSSDYFKHFQTLALTQASASGERLAAMFKTTDGVDPLGINTAFLGASIQSHTALREIQAEFDSVLQFFSSIIRICISTLIFHDFSELRLIIEQTISLLPQIPQVLKDLALPYLEIMASIINAFKTGNLVIPKSRSTGTFDPALLYWSSTDRTIAVVAGYATVVLLITLYVVLETPITRFATFERKLRNTLRQAGGVFKVILIISIEMLVFPFYCGMLLDLAFLPLFADASVASRVAFASNTPYVFCFVHWFVGTCYMFHFALFVGMCRKILRKGVLWFIRDPDDPTFHPVRDVLERNVTTQLRKIAFSALVYGALVILCLGGVIWGIGKVFTGIFPIYWTETEPTVEFPLNLLLYNVIAPLFIHLFKPSEVIHEMYAWWLKRCARMLRLSHFLFDDRRADEEGHSPEQRWAGVKRLLQPQSVDSTVLEGDGQFVLTPCNDQYRPPKPGEAFLHVGDDDVYIANKSGERNEAFAKVYIPPLFKTRVTLFMACLWIFSAISGLCSTLLPLILGRRMLSMVVVGVRLNDIYAYSLGAFTLAALIMLTRQGPRALKYIKDYFKDFDSAATIQAAKTLALRIASVLYVYSFVFLVVPLVLGVIIETHLMVPLHTYFMLQKAGKLDAVLQEIGLVTSAAPLQLPSGRDSSAPLQHTLHIFQDLALGFFVLRILARAIASPGSRAAETIRRATQKGRLDPDALLTTRYLVLPMTALATSALLLPPVVAHLSMLGLHTAGFDLHEIHTTLLYRYSFPIMSISIATLMLLRWVSNVTRKWRARIRDEVYLVGERLHNFGEKRPPTGSRSIMRRDKVMS